MTSKFARVLWAGFWLLGQGAGDIPVLWAQKTGEAENPAFQQEISGQGGPVQEFPSIDGTSTAIPTPSSPTQKVDSVQIATPLYENAETTSPLDTRVTVRVKDAPLSTFLDTISAQAKVNFILTEGLEHKRITAFLRAVSVREALQILLQIKGLTYQRIGRSNTYVVTPRSSSAPNLITKIYTLSFVSLVPLGNIASDRASIGFNSLGGGSGGGASTGGGNTSAGSANAPGGVPAETDGSAGISIVNVIKTTLTKFGKVSLEPRTNSLIITDIPEVFPSVEQIISELDKKAPQVMIEAQIVEINTDKASDIGVSWGGSDGTLLSLTGPTRITNGFPLTDRSVLGGNSTRNLFTSPANEGVAVVEALTGGLLDLKALSVVLKALVTRNEARFLGKPKVMTMNNKGAIIQIIRNQVVGLKSNISSTAGTGSGGSSAVLTEEAERQVTGLTLVVTPQINKEGYITLLLQPTFLDVQESQVTALSTRFVDPVSRGVSSLVRVKNGQTIAVGGLLSTKETKRTRKVPLLGSIPILGWLFTSVSTFRQNTDLVIFITPTIMTD
ncbi:MAG: hypothetical protein HY399_04000 [Elusimicrobia bacterium]|nr:hypothetical protein [Elusimicrobiota bacterium]